MTWTIHTFGDGDLVAMVLNAVKLLVGGGLGSLATAAALAGVAIALAGAAFRTAPWGMLGQWFFGLVLVIWGLLGGTATVTVEDEIDQRIAPQVITNLPLLVALPAAISSEVSYKLTRLATALSLNGEMGDVGTTVARPTLALQSLLDADLPIGDLSQTLVAYIETCVIPEMGTTYTDKDADRAPDLLAYISSTNYAVETPVYVNGKPDHTDLCPNVYTGVLLVGFTYGSSGMQLEYKRTVDQVACSLPGGRGLMTGASAGACQTPQPPWDELQSALATLHLDTVDAETALKNVLVTKAWKLAWRAWYRETDDQNRMIEATSQSVADQQTLQAYAGQALGRRELLRMLRGLADAMVYLSSPFLLVAALSPAIFRILGLYTRMHIWLMLWGPMTAGAHFMLTSVAISTITAAATYGGDGVFGVVRGNWWPLMLETAQFNATAMDIMFAIPALALGLAWGGVSGLAGLMSTGSHTMEQATKTAVDLASGKDVVTRDQLTAKKLYQQATGEAMPTDAVATVGLSGYHFTSASGTQLGLDNKLVAGGRTVELQPDGSVRVTTYEGGAKSQKVTDKDQYGRNVEREKRYRYAGGPTTEADLISEEVRTSGQNTYSEKNGMRWGTEAPFYDPETGTYVAPRYEGPVTTLTRTKRNERGDVTYKAVEDYTAEPGNPTARLITGSAETTVDGVTYRQTYGDHGRTRTEYEGVKDGFQLKGFFEQFPDGTVGEGKVTFSGVGSFWVKDEQGRPHQVTGEFSSSFQTRHNEVLPDTGITKITGQQGESFIVQGDAFGATRETPATAYGDWKQALQRTTGNTLTEHGTTVTLPDGTPATGTRETEFGPRGENVYAKIQGVIGPYAGQAVFGPNGRLVHTTGKSGYGFEQEQRQRYVVDKDTPLEKRQFGLVELLPGATVEQTAEGRWQLSGPMLMSVKPYGEKSYRTLLVTGAAEAIPNKTAGDYKILSGQVSAITEGQVAGHDLAPVDHGYEEDKSVAQISVDPATGQVYMTEEKTGKERSVKQDAVTIDFGTIAGKGVPSRRLREAAEQVGVPKKDLDLWAAGIFSGGRTVLEGVKVANDLRRGKEGLLGKSGSGPAEATGKGGDREDSPWHWDVFTPPWSRERRR